LIILGKSFLLAKNPVKSIVGSKNIGIIAIAILGSEKAEPINNPKEFPFKLCRAQTR